MYLNSLSFGIRNIAAGKISKEDVKYIITGTRFSNPEEAIRAYTDNHWKENPEKCASLCRELWPKVIQPRIILGDDHFPYCGCSVYAFDSLEDFELLCSTRRYNVITELKKSGYIQ